MKIRFAGVAEKFEGALFLFPAVSKAADLSFLSESVRENVVMAMEKGKNDYFFPIGKKGASEIIVLAEKKRGRMRPESWRNLAAQIVVMARKRQYQKVSIEIGGLSPDALKPFLEGLILGGYEFDHYRKKKGAKIAEIVLLGKKDDWAKDKEILAATVIECEAVNYVRDLVNQPANVINPDALMEEARRTAKLPKMKVKIHGEKELKKMKMGALLAVGKGSKSGAKMAVIEYRGGKKSEDSLLLVGKGVTFDSGGLNLKTGAGINNMKMDMAGAATVLGVMRIAAGLGLKKNIIALIPSAENMVDSVAVKPNDIITAHNGLTVEITNTDAEGRLILADALAYGIENFHPVWAVDVATLTGACIVALGNEISGVLGNNQKLVNKILAAGKITDEKVWQLPLDKKLRTKVKGHHSDLKNHTPEVGGGAIMGAAFLSYFIGKSAWAHIDMGGSAWNASDDGYWKKGGSGRNVRLLWELIKQEER